MILVIVLARLFTFHLFADDSNLFCSDNSLSNFEYLINIELLEVYKWLCANKLSIKRVNYVPKLYINNVRLKQEDSIKYLGIYIDSHLNWKSQVLHISKKLKEVLE